MNVRDVRFLDDVLSVTIVLVSDVLGRERSEEVKVIGGFKRVRLA